MTASSGEWGLSFGDISSVGPGYGSLLATFKELLCVKWVKWLLI